MRSVGTLREGKYLGMAGEMAQGGEQAQRILLSHRTLNSIPKEVTQSPFYFYLNTFLWVSNRFCLMPISQFRVLHRVWMCCVNYSFKSFKLLLKFHLYGEGCSNPPLLNRILFSLESIFLSFCFSLSTYTYLKYLIIYLFVY